MFLVQVRPMTFFSTCSVFHFSCLSALYPNTIKQKIREIVPSHLLSIFLFGHSLIYPLHSTCHFMICSSRNLSSLHPSIYPSSIRGNMKVCLRPAALCAALRPAGPVLCQCQISTHVWSSSDTSSIYPCTPILSFSLFLFLFLSSPCFSRLVVFFIYCLFL